MAVIPNDPETQLRRKATAEALTEAGYPTATATLATLASRGGGPKFRKYGKYPIYTWGVALAWAISRMSRPVSSTSELDVPDEPPPDIGGLGAPMAERAGAARPDDRPTA